MPARVLPRGGAGMLSSSGKGRQKERTKSDAKPGGEGNSEGKEPETQRQNHPNYCSHSNSRSPSSRRQADAYRPPPIAHTRSPWRR